MLNPGPLFIVGSGPMMGSHIASLFASKTFTKIALFARSSSNLEQNVSFIKATSPAVTIKTYIANVTDTLALTTALQTAVSDLGVPEVVVFNAARIKFGVLGSYSPEDIVIDFKIPNLGLYTTALVLLPLLRKLAEEKPDSHPSLFVTSSFLIERSLVPVFSLGMAKTAQASLVRLLAEENRGVVHVALVTAGGPIGFEEKVNNPPKIAERFWELWEQKKGAWEGEVRHGW